MITKKCVVNIFKRLNYSLINNILLWVIFTLRVHRGLSVGICRFSTHTHIHTRTQRERGTNLGQKDGESPRKAATTIYFTNMLHARAAIPLKSNTPPHHHPTPNAHRPIFPTQRPPKMLLSLWTVQPHGQAARGRRGYTTQTSILQPAEADREGQGERRQQTAEQ